MTDSEKCPCVLHGGIEVAPPLGERLLADLDAGLQQCAPQHLMCAELARSLIAEVRRLREVIKAAMPCEHCCPHCPWCDRGDEVDGRDFPNKRHAPNCAAFNPDGSVK